MYLPNLIMDILIGLAFIIKVCFKGFMKVYAYGILPYILLVSVLNIYSLKKIVSTHLMTHSISRHN